MLSDILSHLSHKSVKIIPWHAEVFEAGLILTTKCALNGPALHG